MNFNGGPNGRFLVDATDAGVGVARTEVSLDGVHWRTSDPAPWTFWPRGELDVREGMIGGVYGVGSRVLHSRVVDRLGNVTVVPDRLVTVSTDRTSSDPPVDFAIPLPAITGHDFTIAPVFNEAYRVPAGRKCGWTLVWGDEKVRLEGWADPTFGEVRTTVAPVNGICEPWTFTLPYTPTGQAVGILAPRGPGHGWAQVYVDGALVATVNLSSAAAQGARVVWQRSFGAVGAHTVRVRTLGTVGHPRVAVDGFAVLR